MRRLVVECRVVQADSLPARRWRPSARSGPARRRETQLVDIVGCDTASSQEVDHARLARLAKAMQGPTGVCISRSRRSSARCRAPTQAADDLVVGGALRGAEHHVPRHHLGGQVAAARPACSPTSRRCTAPRRGPRPAVRCERAVDERGRTRRWIALAAAPRAAGRPRPARVPRSGRRGRRSIDGSARAERRGWRARGSRAATSRMAAVNEALIRRRGAVACPSRRPAIRGLGR